MLQKYRRFFKWLVSTRLLHQGRRLAGGGLSHIDDVSSLPDSIEINVTLVLTTIYDNGPRIQQGAKGTLFGQASRL
jgi:hypothetical protein